MRRRHFTLTTIVVALTALLTPTTAWATDADTSPVQERIDEVIAEHGGDQTAWNEVSWDDGDIVLTIANDQNISIDDARGTSVPTTTAAASADNCASGKYCVYSRINYGGDKLTYSSCPATYTSFSLSGPIRSIKNDRSSGTVKAYNGSTLKKTLSPGTGTVNISNVTKITCTT